MNNGLKITNWSEAYIWSHLQDTRTVIHFGYALFVRTLLAARTYYRKSQIRQHIEPIQKAHAGSIVSLITPKRYDVKIRIAEFLSFGTGRRTDRKIFQIANNH